MYVHRPEPLRRDPTPEERAQEAANRLKRAERRSRMAQLGPKAFHGSAAENLLDAIAVAEEWDVVGVTVDA